MVSVVKQKTLEQCYNHFNPYLSSLGDLTASRLKRHPIHYMREI